MDQNFDLPARTKLMQENGAPCARGGVKAELLESLRTGGKTCRFKVLI